ncbi:LysR family transcriptional regulator [Nocardioides zeae]|uniref:LysR family transcriptional regulator n=1 Tax=Nocardioides imazamoxiresistens TaxID=3231893 RepID=A0ABU3PTY5_9ACTN|nr:LysR family transcriptional regulator [Nocardioides zeae]MDT9592654.1 LysR family transcriptional regulator [Nocardioides zeae]
MSARVSPDDLLVLLEVGRTGRFTRAGEVLGLNHTTVARRIGAAEKALGGRVLTRSISGWELTALGRQAVAAAERIARAVDALDGDPGGAVLEDVVRVSTPDAFAFHVAAPAAAAVRERHPGVGVEIIAATRRAASQRSGLDVEVVVGKPDVLRAEATRLGRYVLGLYASPAYLQRHGTPERLEDLRAHRLVYFIGSMLQLDYLDVGRRLLPEMADAVTSTDVVTHVEATRAGAGIGLVPTFLASRHPDLQRLLPAAVDRALEYWIVTRAEGMRRAAVAAVVEQLFATFAELSDDEGRLL